MVNTEIRSKVILTFQWLLGNVLHIAIVICVFLIVVELIKSAFVFRNYYF